MVAAALIPPELGDNEKVSPGIVAGWLGVSRTTVKAWSADGRLPPPVRLGPRTQYYLVGELRAALARLDTERAPRGRRGA
jgi:predicted DNA-binding transcriptional regulator AlpA